MRRSYEWVQYSPIIGAVGGKLVRPAVARLLYTRLNTNLFGVIHGIQCFVPRLRKHGEVAHVVNTASMAGLYVGNRQTGAYSASKHAVVALSEALAKDLEGTKIGVSVLTPAGVNTAGYSSSAELRGNIGGPNLYPTEPHDLRSGLQPDEVARRVLEAVRAGLFFITTHPETRPWVMDRYKRLMESYDFAERWAVANPPPSDP